MLISPIYARPQDGLLCEDAVVAVDGVDQSDWPFKFSMIDAKHVASVARGPPHDATPSYRDALPFAALPCADLRAAAALTHPPFEQMCFQDLVPAGMRK